MSTELRAQTLGLVGGGQLGRMLVHAAQRMGLRTQVLDPDADASAMRAADATLCAAYDDRAALTQLAASCAAVTTEFENVPAASLEHLAACGAQVSPPAAAVRIAQDRVAEKRFFDQCAAKSHGIGPVPWAEISGAEHLQALPANLLPGVLKTARMGYDGKGQVRVADAGELATAWEQLGRVPCVLERRVNLGAECSVVLARHASGQVVHLPLQVNEHRQGVLHCTQVGLHRSNTAGEVFLMPNSPAVAVNTMFDAAKTIADQLNYVGVLCVEFFVLTDGSLAINEIAPRPHNSGHHSIESCDVSQFELQARCALGWPLVQPQLRGPACMFNLLGDEWLNPDGSARSLPTEQLLALNGLHLHLYGKAQARPGRKMGHITLTGPNAQAVQTQAARVQQLLGWT